MSRKQQFKNTASKEETLKKELGDLEKAAHALAMRLRAYYAKGGQNSDMLSLYGSGIAGVVMREGDDKRGWQGNGFSDTNPMTGIPYGQE